jgi:hypothetical protein
MVNEHTYAPTLIETARANIGAVVAEIMRVTGLQQTFLSRFASRDSAFLKRLPDTSMNIRTYDEVMARLSAAFPEGCIWPAAVPRPVPADLDDVERQELAAMIVRRRAIKAQDEARDARARAKQAAEEAKEKSLEAREATKAARSVTAEGAAAPAQM